MKITLTDEEIGRWAEHYDDLGLLLMLWFTWTEQPDRSEREERMEWIRKMIAAGPDPVGKAICGAARVALNRHGRSS